jgi:hypothetical protein
MSVELNFVLLPPKQCESTMRLYACCLQSELLGRPSHCIRNATIALRYVTSGVMCLDKWPCRTINNEGFQQVIQRPVIREEMQTCQRCPSNELSVMGSSSKQLRGQRNISCWVIHKEHLAAPNVWDKYEFNKLNHLGQSSTFSRTGGLVITSLEATRSLSSELAGSQPNSLLHPKYYCFPSY